jgi:WD40 repeat protein
LRGARLAATLDWADGSGGDAALTTVERAFLTASRGAATRETRRLRVLLAAALALLVAALVAGGVALSARGAARHQATAATAQRLGAQALVEPLLDRSLLLAREAVRLEDSPETRSNLLAALMRSPAALAVAHPSGQRVVDGALDPSGRTLAVRGDDGAITFLDTRGLRRRGERLFTLGNNTHFGAVTRPLRSLAYSPDGRRLAAGDSDDAHATVLLFDAVTHDEVAYATDESTVVTTDVVYAPDGRTLVTGEAVTGRITAPPLVLVVRRASDGVELRRSPPIPAGRLVGFGPGGRSLLVTSGEAVSYLLDWRTFERLRTLRVSGTPALSADGRLAAFGDDDGEIRVADLRRGAVRTAGRSPGTVTSIAFAPGGRLFASGSSGGTIVVWDAVDGFRESLPGHAGAVVGLVFSRDGRTLFSGSADGTVMAMDVTGERRLAQPFAYAPVASRVAGPPRPGSGSTAVAVSPDGSLFATQPGRDRVTLWRASDLTVVGELRGPCGSLDSLAFSHDGRLLAAAGDARNTVVWDVRTHRIVKLLGQGARRGGGASGVDFSPDDTLVATAGVDGRLRVSDVRTGRLFANIPGHTTLQDVDFSSDGQLVVGAGLGKKVVVWDLPHQRLVRMIDQPDLIFAIRMSPDGRSLVTGDSRGSVRFWDARTGRAAGRTIGGQNGSATSVTYDPTGTELMTTSSDGKVRLWDLHTSKLIGAPLDFSERARWGWGTYFPDGRHVVIVFDSGLGVVWNVDPGAWAEQACRIANRDLTTAERRDFLPGRASRPTCPA